MEDVPTTVNSGDVHGESTPPETQEHRCEKCAQSVQDQEIAFAFLLALMPVVTLTLFGNMGLL